MLVGVRVAIDDIPFIRTGCGRRCGGWQGLDRWVWANQIGGMAFRRFRRHRRVGIHAVDRKGADRCRFCGLLLDDGEAPGEDFHQPCAVAGGNLRYDPLGPTRLMYGDPPKGHTWS